MVHWLFHVQPVALCW